MSLRSDAIDAYNTDWESQARTVLGDVLTPFDVSGLTRIDLQVRAKFTVAVFTDGDIHLAVQLFADGTNAVSLVADGGAGGWTKQAPVTSLANLGGLLPTYDPTDENATA